MIDLHSHLIPGVDDGARSLDDARAALAAFRDAGVRTVVTTPHFDASLTHRPRELDARLRELDHGWDALRSLAPEFPDLSIHRGVEVRLDIPRPDLHDPRLRLAGSSAVLVEFDGFAMPLFAAEVLQGLRDQGVAPLLAHPERYRDASLERLRDLARQDVLLQVNAGSLTGRYGADARALARALVREGLATLVSSDYHARGRLHLADARDAVADEVGEAAARLLFETNARHLLDDEPPLPVPGLAPPAGPVDRLRRWLRDRLGR